MSWIKVSDDNEGTYALEADNPIDVVTVERLNVLIAAHDAVIADHEDIPVPVTASPDVRNAIDNENVLRAEIKDRQLELKQQKTDLKNELTAL